MKCFMSKFCTFTGLLHLCREIKIMKIVHTTTLKYHNHYFMTDNHLCYSMTTLLSKHVFCKNCCKIRSKSKMSGK